MTTATAVKEAAEAPEQAQEPQAPQEAQPAPSERPEGFPAALEAEESWLVDQLGEAYWERETPETVGELLAHRRSPRGQYEQRVEAMPADEPVYIAGDRGPALKLGSYLLKPGEVVPGAHHWVRREAWERAGRIVRKKD